MNVPKTRLAWMRSQRPEASTFASRSGLKCRAAPKAEPGNRATNLRTIAAKRSFIVGSARTDAKLCVRPQ